jgi:mxaA protein
MRAQGLKAFLCAVLLGLALPVVAETPSGVIKQSFGREFGVLTGDLIQHRFVVQLPAGYQLAESSLPVSGDLNYWLNLRDVSLQALEGNTQRQLFSVELTYQTFYAPLDVRTLEIPSHRLRAHRNGDQEIYVTLPEWQFTMSPLKDITPRGVGSDETEQSFMKPALVPLSQGVVEQQKHIILLIVITAFLLLVWAYLRGWLWQRQQSPFQQAQRKIRQINAYQNDELTACQAAVTAIHDGFNQVAGHAVFIHQLPDFYQQNPSFSRYSTEIDAFFQQSHAVLFGQQTVALPTLSSLQKLARRLQQAEPVSQGKP